MCSECGFYGILIRDEGSVRTHGIRRPHRRWYAERNHHRAKANLIAIDQAARRYDSFLADVRAILAAKVLYGRILASNDETGVVTGDARRINPHRRVRRPAKNVFAGVDRYLPRRPYQPIPDRRHRALNWNRVILDFANEPVPEPVHGPDKARGLGGVVQCPPDFLDQARQIRVENERRRPEFLLEIGPRHRPGPVLDENLQKLQGLRREVNFFAVPQETSGVGVERKTIEAKGHSVLGLPL